MKICALFPGQGSQYIGMLSSLASKYSFVNQILLDANDILGIDIRKMILGSDMQKLMPSSIAQPAVVLASHVLFCVFSEECQIDPVCAIGHSLGEISALQTARCLDLESALLFAHRRGKIMHRAYEEKKGRCALVTGISRASLEKILSESLADKHPVSITCYNSPQQFVVAGEADAVKAMGALVLKENGEMIPFQMMPMKVDAPYHSGLMNFIVEEMTFEINQLKVNPMAWEVISTVTGEPCSHPSAVKKTLRAQLERPVLWTQALSEAAKKGIDLFVDMGPHTQIKNLVCENMLGIPCLAFDDIVDRKELINRLGSRIGANIL